MNLYGYANNDPVNLIDVTGKNPAVVVVGGAILAEAVASFAVTLAIADCVFNNCNGVRDLFRDPADDIRESRRKGERGHTAKPDGTPNPDKKIRENPETGEREYKDPHTGKKVRKPRRPPNKGFTPSPWDDDDEEDDACE